MTDPGFSASDCSPWFWEVIAKARTDGDRLKRLLVEMSREEIVQFYNEYVRAAVEPRCSPFMDHMPLSEDGVQDVTEWIVSQGKTYYGRIIKHPKEIPVDLPPGTASFKGIALQVFWERFGESIPYRKD